MLAVLLLFFLIMGLAGSVDINTLKAQFDRKLGISCGLGCQFALMPLIGFLIISIGQPEEHVALTLMILVSSSGGAYSNWWCSLFNADLALSVAMTAVSTLVSAVMLPLNLTFYLKLLSKGQADIDVPWVELFKGVSTVIAGVLTGVCFSTRYPRAKRRLTLVGNFSGMGMVLLTLFAAVAPRKQCNPDAEEITPPWGKRPEFYAVVASPFFAALALSLFISSLRMLRLARPERVAITIEVSYQNVGVASAVALTAFCSDPHKLSDAVAVPLIYGLLEAIALAFFCLVAWKAGWTYAPREAALCHVLKGDFQPQHCPAPEATGAPMPDEIGCGEAEKAAQEEKAVPTPASMPPPPMPPSISPAGALEEVTDEEQVLDLEHFVDPATARRMLRL